MCVSRRKRRLRSPPGRFNRPFAFCLPRENVHNFSTAPMSADRVRAISSGPEGRPTTRYARPVRPPARLRVAAPSFSVRRNISGGGRRRPFGPTDDGLPIARRPSVAPGATTRRPRETICHFRSPTTRISPRSSIVHTFVLGTPVEIAGPLLLPSKD